MKSLSTDTTMSALRRQIPEELACMLSKESWQRITIGESSASTFRVLTSESSYGYLKILGVEEGKPEFAKLRCEKERLEWFAGRVLVPEVLYFGQDTQREYLLSSEIKGVPAHVNQFVPRAGELVHLLGTGLRMLHSQSITDCPFDTNIRAKLDQAKQYVACGLVDESNFQVENKGRSATDLLTTILTLEPPVEELVITHGDYCLPNVIVGEDLREIRGFIDVGAAGIADRYQDLALAARSIGFNLGKKWVREFFESYGLKEIDHGRIHYFLLLDEFF